jgi:HSP20 family protein
MAAQTTNDQRSQQSQPVTRGSQRQAGLSRSPGYAVGLPVRTSDLFRVDPFSMMPGVTDELDRVFEDSSTRDQPSASAGAWAPVIEVIQADGGFVIRAELPGVNANDVQLEITGDAIVIQGERQAADDQGRGVSERWYGRFYRAIPLPNGAKIDEARATYGNGILEVTVPTEERRRLIPIHDRSQETAKSSSSRGSRRKNSSSQGSSSHSSSEKQGSSPGSTVSSSGSASNPPRAA